MKSQVLASLLILTPALVAQDDDRQPPPKKGVQTEEVRAVVSGDSEIEILPDGSRVIRTTNKNGETIETHLPPGDPAAGGVPDLPPDEMARRGGGFFEAAVMVRPRRLAAGETGELYIHVTLRGNGVVVPGASIHLTYDKTQGPLAFGTEELKPARAGIRETYYKGKPVWDDALTFKIPVSVASDAKPGNVAFKGSVQLEVTDGRTGEMLGRFRAEAPGRIPIGRPFPHPVPQVGTGERNRGTTKGVSEKPPGTGANAADASGTGATPSKAAGGSGAKATGEGHLVGESQPAGGTRERSAPRQSEDPVGTAPGHDWLDLAFWGVGGLLLLGLVLLVLRRR